MAWRSAALLSTTVLGQEYTLEVPGLGSLKGAVSRYDVAQFLGVPYAKPPVGALRWQPPEAYGSWDSPRDATKYGHACIQPPGLHDQPISEDCLFLNIATPAAQLESEEKLTTMFWMHGGAYVLGEAATYPIDALVSASGHQVVVAAVNYRLGFFGFAGSKEIQARTSDGSAGNFGLQDQRLAMFWVRDHIAAFGGDGSKMTIFGESAGGNSVMNHLAMPKSAGLYQRAMVQSGTYHSGAQPMSAAERDYKKLLKAAKCNDLECLLTANTTVINDQSAMIAMPVIDGIEFNASSALLIHRGEYQKDVDVLLGSNRDEIGYFIGSIVPKNCNEAEFDALLTFMLKNPLNIPKARKLYDPKGDYPYPEDLVGYGQKWWQVIRMATDGVGIGVFSKDDEGVFALGHCAARHIARDLKAGGTRKVYQYLFAAPLPGGLVQHGDEIGYAFGDVDAFPKDSDKATARAMSQYWTSFAITGEPKGIDLPTWPAYEAETDTVLRFDETIYAQEKLRSAACDFWQAHPIHINANSLPIFGADAQFGKVLQELPYVKERISNATLLI